MSVHHYDKVLSSDEKTRYSPRPDTGQTIEGPSPADAGSGKARRGVWLVESETKGQATYHNIPKIIRAWDARSDADRKRLGGPRAWRKLLGGKRSKTRAYFHVYSEIRRAFWERAIEGKPPAYGFGLWCLLKDTRKVPRPAMLDQWNALNNRRGGSSLPSIPSRSPLAPGNASGPSAGSTRP